MFKAFWAEKDLHDRIMSSKTVLGAEKSPLHCGTHSVLFLPDSLMCQSLFTFRSKQTNKQINKSSLAKKKQFLSDVKQKKNS